MIVLVESTVLGHQSSKNIKNDTQHPRDTPLRNLQILAPTDNGARRTIDFGTYFFFGTALISSIKILLKHVAVKSYAVNTCCLAIHVVVPFFERGGGDNTLVFML